MKVYQTNIDKATAHLSIHNATAATTKVKLTSIPVKGHLPQQVLDQIPQAFSHRSASINRPVTSTQPTFLILVSNRRDATRKRKRQFKVENGYTLEQNLIEGKPRLFATEINYFDGEAMNDDGAIRTCDVFRTVELPLDAKPFIVRLLCVID